MLRIGATPGGSNPPSDTNQIPTVFAKIDFGAHRLRFRVVGQAETEAAVDLEFVVGFRLAEGGDQVAELVQDGGDLVCAEMADLLWALRDGAAAVEGSLPFGLGFGDPAGHKAGVGAGVKGGSVAFDLDVVSRDDAVVGRGGRGGQADGGVFGEGPRWCALVGLVRMPG